MESIGGQQVLIAGHGISSRILHNGLYGLVLLRDGFLSRHYTAIVMHACLSLRTCSGDCVCSMLASWRVVFIFLGLQCFWPRCGGCMSNPSAEGRMERYAARATNEISSLEPRHPQNVYSE
eukprot:1153397-Amphidinium_carterae.1